MPEKTMTDLQMANDGLRVALKRAAGAIQGLSLLSRTGINGEAVTALAYAVQNDGESWQAAVDRALAQLAKDWPNAMKD